MEELPELPPLPVYSPEHLHTLDMAIQFLVDSQAMTPADQQEREDLCHEMEVCQRALPPPACPSRPAELSLPGSSPAAIVVGPSRRDTLKAKCDPVPSCVTYAQGIARSAKPLRNAKLHLFGSSRNGFGAKGSDVDLGLLVDWPPPGEIAGDGHAPEEAAAKAGSVSLRQREDPSPQLQESEAATEAHGTVAVGAPRPDTPPDLFSMQGLDAALMDNLTAPSEDLHDSIEPEAGAAVPRDNGPRRRKPGAAAHLSAARHEGRTSQPLNKDGKFFQCPECGEKQQKWSPMKAHLAETKHLKGDMGKWKAECKVQGLFIRH